MTAIDAFFRKIRSDTLAVIGKLTVGFCSYFSVIKVFVSDLAVIF